MTNLFKLQLGDTNDFLGKLAQGGFTADLAQRVRVYPDLARIMVKALETQTDVSPVHGLFTCPYDQISRLRNLNAMYGWGFSDEEFEAARRGTPAWPEEKLVALTLVPYLKDRPGVAGMRWTFNVLGSNGGVAFKAFTDFFSELKDSFHGLRLRRGLAHRPGLRWEAIDFGANRGVDPNGIRPVRRLPHAGVLAAFALHPTWVKAMDGADIPYVWVPGYEFDLKGASQSSTPSIRYQRDEDRAHLSYGWTGGIKSTLCVPEFCKVA